MTIGVIELRPKACHNDAQWAPAVVGNVSRPSTIRYAADYDDKTGVVTIKTLSFLKDGHVAWNERTKDQLKYSSYAPLLHRHGRAIGTVSSNGGWSSGHIEREDTRLVEFKTIKELNEYLAVHGIKPVAVAKAAVDSIVLAPQTQTVEELYQELAKVMATNPKAASSPVVKCSVDLDTAVLTDEQLGQQTVAISKALLNSAVSNVAKQFEQQANAQIARIYKELNPRVTVPTVALTATVVPKAPKAPK